jgi:hypothetical protein
MKCVAGEDDYNGQKTFVDELTAIARDYGMHIHLVHHIKQAGQRGPQAEQVRLQGLRRDHRPGGQRDERVAQQGQGEEPPGRQDGAEASPTPS